MRRVEADGGDFSEQSVAQKAGEFTVKNRKHMSLNGPAQLGFGATGRFVYVGLIVAALALMLASKLDTKVMNDVRAAVTDTLAPLMEALSRPVASFERLVGEAVTLRELRAENIRLRAQNRRLMEWQAAARKLAIENRQIKALLNFAPGAEPGFATARVFADAGGPFVRSILVGAGSRDGVTKGQAVITGSGLVGRVQGVGKRAVRVLLLTDLNSRIPVVVESNRARAILAGDNSARPRLIHLPPGAIVNVGDRIVTSGHGGAFPPGIPVGVVIQVGEKVLRVKPYIHPDQLEYVRIVDYGLKGILDSSSAAEGAGVSR